MKDGTITRNGKNHRPHWNYLIPKSNGGSTPTDQTQVLEMLESVRNAVEGLQQSQMLQCDVALAIKDLAHASREISATLKRIDRRMQRNGWHV